MTNLTIDSIQKCKLCGGSFTVRAVLDLANHFWPEVDVVVCGSPCCDHREELRVEDGKVERGYVYAAGSAHFCGMEEYDVPTLEVETKRMTAEQSTRRYRLPRRDNRNVTETLAQI